MVGERFAVTNEDIYNLCQDILTAVRNYNEQEIANQREMKQKLDNIASALRDIYTRLNAKLDEMYEGIKTLSDNQVVIDEKIEDLKTRLDGIRSVVEELRAVLPGV